jgi:uncharacterized protein YbaR (Trm112 family)
MRAPGAIADATALLRELASAVRAGRRNAVLHAAHPPAAGFVLDVGSGQAPHPRADVVVDKYVADDFERGYALELSKPLVVGDGHALPFADGTFAYVVTSHVVEHATDPVRFAAELGRVAAAGFVQVPSREAELTFGWEFHPWLIDREGDTLLFHPRGEARAPLGPVFHEAMAESRLFGLWFVANRERWHHSIEWQGALRLRCEGASQAPQTASLDVSETLRTLEALAKAGRARGPNGALRDALRCPLDRGRLTFSETVATCGACGRRYPVAGTVPVLVEEAAGHAKAAG